MAVPTKESTGLELRKDSRGNLHLWHKGQRIPTTKITFASEPTVRRGAVAVEILAQFIQVVDEH